jgi:hypothetical protein
LAVFFIVPPRYKALSSFNFSIIAFIAVLFIKIRQLFLKVNNLILVPEKQPIPDIAKAAIYSTVNVSRDECCYA